MYTWHKTKFKAIKIEVNNVRENPPLDTSRNFKCDASSSGHVTPSGSPFAKNLDLKVSNVLAELQKLNYSPIDCLKPV